MKTPFLIVCALCLSLAAASAFSDDTQPTQGNRAPALAPVSPIEPDRNPAGAGTSPETVAAAATKAQESPILDPFRVVLPDALEKLRLEKVSLQADPEARKKFLEESFKYGRVRLTSVELTGPTNEFMGARVGFIVGEPAVINVFNPAAVRNEDIEKSLILLDAPSTAGAKISCRGTASFETQGSSGLDCPGAMGCDAFALASEMSYTKISRAVELKSLTVLDFADEANGKLQLVCRKIKLQDFLYTSNPLEDDDVLALLSFMGFKLEKDKTSDASKNETVETQRQKLEEMLAAMEKITNPAEKLSAALATLVAYKNLERLQGSVPAVVVPAASAE